MRLCSCCLRNSARAVVGPKQQTHWGVSGWVTRGELFASQQWFNKPVVNAQRSSFNSLVKVI